MQLIVNGRNMEVTDWIEEYVQKRVKKLERYLPNLGDVRAEVVQSAARAAEDRYTVQLTLWSKGQILRAEESTADVFASVDAAVDKIANQVRRFKGKHKLEKRRASAAIKVEREEAAPEEEEEEAAPTPVGEIVRRKEFLMMPMSEKEAVEQLELIGHDFYVYYNPTTSTPNVIYKRKDGNYGVLQPQLG